MYDTFFFEDGILPDNKVPANYDFQTKSLGCELDVYKISSDGQVKRFEMEGQQIDGPINDTVYVYSYEFMYDNEFDFLNRKYLGSKYQEFKVMILNNKVVYAEKTKEIGYEMDNK